VAKQPKFKAQHSSESKLPWRVNVPAQYSESGKRERFYFATQNDAKTFSEKQKIRIENQGTATHLLTAGQREAAVTAFQLLGDATSPTRLIDIVRQHLQLEKKNSASTTVNALCLQFEASKAEKSAHYHVQLRCGFALLKPLGEKLVNAIEPNDLEGVVQGLSASSRNGHLRVFRAAFNFAIKKGWCLANPVLKLDFAEIKHTEVEVLTNAEVKALLKACCTTDRELLPYHLFGLFTGIRPLELERMTWEHVRTNERHILLPADVTKTGKRRVIEMEKTLCIWLRWLKWKRPAFTGLIAPNSNLRARLRMVREAAKIEEWVQDVMRHTYASNWLAKFENVDRLRANMGHRSNDVLWNHYHRAVLRKDADVFWGLTPKVVLKRQSKTHMATSAPQP